MNSNLPTLSGFLKILGLVALLPVCLPLLSSQEVSGGDTFGAIAVSGALYRRSRFKV